MTENAFKTVPKVTMTYDLWGSTLNAMYVGGREKNKRLQTIMIQPEESGQMMAVQQRGAAQHGAALCAVLWYSTVLGHSTVARAQCSGWGTVQWPG